MRKSLFVFIVGLILYPATVLAQNTPPVAEAGPDVSVFVDEPAGLQGNAYDPNGNAIVSWEWSVVSSPIGSSPVLFYSDRPAAVLVGDLAGDYVVQLVVSDGMDFSQPDTATVSVRELLPPVALVTADVTSGAAPLVVQFDGSQSYDPQGGELYFMWDFGDSTPVSDEVSPAHEYIIPGDYVASLTVLDDLGQTDIETILISVTVPQQEEIEYSIVTIDNPNPRPGAAFGAGVAGSDDLNGDGVPDLLVSAPNSPGPQVFAFSGKDTTLILTIDDPSAQTWNLFGECLTSVDDINGDGIPDILTGSQGQDVGGNNSQGQAYIFSGADGALLRTIDHPEPQPNACFGWGLCSIEDVDGDTQGDYVIPACGHLNQGKVYLFSGSSGVLIRSFEVPYSRFFGEWTADIGDISGDSVSDLLIGDRDINQAFVFSPIDGTLLLTIDNPNPQSNGQFGFRLDGSGDVNSDGIPDVLVGATGHIVNGYRTGQAFVLSGFDGSHLLTLDNPNPQAGDNFGWSVAGISDVNIDGVPDMLVSAPGQTVGGNSHQGQAYLFSGSDGSLLKILDNPNPQPNAGFGEMVADVGDLNGDGISDLLIGAYMQNVGGNQVQGQAFLYLSMGTAAQTIQITTDEIQAVIEENQGLPLAEAMEDALADVEEAQEALEEIPPYNHAAVQNIEAAVGELENAVDDGVLDPEEGNQLMAQLAQAARLLAVDAIDKAIAGSGDPERIAEAQQFLAEGDALSESGAFTAAVIGRSREGNRINGSI
jgi:PKD repeat protein